MNSKYRNKRTPCMSQHIHASKKEVRRCNELTLMARNGEIVGLMQQPRFPLVVNGVHVCEYRADWRYVTKAGDTIVEDCKSDITRHLPVYKIKKKLMSALWNIDIFES